MKRKLNTILIEVSQTQLDGKKPLRYVAKACGKTLQSDDCNVTPKELAIQLATNNNWYNVQTFVNGLYDCNTDYFTAESESS